MPGIKIDGYLGLLVLDILLVVCSMSRYHHVQIGENVTLTCEGSGYPTPSLLWTREVDQGYRDDLPGDRSHVSLQTRGGPASHGVTTWIMFT